jgi:putative membrane protein
MFIHRSYPLKVMLGWTTKFIVVFFIIDAIPVLLHYLVGPNIVLVPWLPITLIGTALAFYLGFKANSSYDRLWEARKAWGGIVNDSRSFTVMVSTYVKGENSEEIHELKRKMIRRHVAWLTAMRFQLRERRTWEHNNLRDNEGYRAATQVDEFENKLEESIKPYLSEEDAQHVLGKMNRATHLLHLQMQDLAKLNNAGYLDSFHHAEIGNMIRSLFDQQGISERIKNFPFPRQYASLNFYYVWIFICLLPFGMVGEFIKLGDGLVWLNIPFCALISWVFYTMEMIGDYSENPFEGSFNDVPVTALSRTIEIDLLEILGETDIPQPRTPKNGVLF